MVVLQLTFRRLTGQQDRNKYSIGLIISQGRILESLCIALWGVVDPARFIEKIVVSEEFDS